jgi:pyruvate/2-oxoglutarate dehydrogenase complex dihydrolipoamide acyltransferase (E2) component
MKDIEVSSYKRAGEEGEVSTTPTLIAEAEDQPAVVMVADTDIMPSTPLTKREVEVREVEALLTSKKKKENEAADSELVVAMAVATPPVEDIPMDSLLKQVEDVAFNTMSSVVKRVTVKNATKPKKIKTEPAASPLARLLAQELNLKLVDIGKGTGKNGRILIDDVRKFQAKVEEAKKSISSSGAYFASVSA